MNYEYAVFSHAQDERGNLSADTLAHVAQLLHDRSGIVLGEHKEETIKRHLGAYARRLGLHDIDAYLDYLHDHPDASEWADFINVFTINHTAFFREAHHFKTLADYLSDRNRPIHLWSAATSTGEEAYSMAIVAQESLPQTNTYVHILASDIDTAALDKAQRGIYRKERVEKLDIERLRRFFLRGRGRNKGLVRVQPKLQNMIDFQVINLNASSGWPGHATMYVIFCRNTLIYFDRSTQIRLLERFAQVLKPGGLLFVGHSENFSFLTSVLRLKGQTVYERPAE